MKRRDLIIISALINAGLLIVLFATALKSDMPSEAMATSTPELSVPMRKSETKRAKDTSVIASGDEVDQVLKEFAARSMPKQMPQSSSSSQKQEIEVTPSFTPIATSTSSGEKKEESRSFAEELAKKYAAEIAPTPASYSRRIAESSTSDFVEVRIKQGDYLDKIARNHRTSVGEIMRANNLTKTNLKIGQIIKVPTKMSAVKTSSAKKTPSQLDYYIVRDGDNPWTIAKKNKISVNELLRLNQIDEASARKLKPGDQLRTR